MSDPAIFGSKLRRLRQEQGLTQDVLAELAGCATQTIRKIEAGARRPSHQMADRLAQVLGLVGDERRTFILMARALAEPAPSDAPPPQKEVRPAATALNLPTYRTLFIGREREQAELLRLMENAGGQLITLQGPGGIGKTRL